MILARPADDEIETIILHAYDDLLDQRAHDPLACGDGRPFRMPGALDVGAEPMSASRSSGVTPFEGVALNASSSS